MTRFYFSRAAPPHPVFPRTLVSGVIEAESLDAAKVAMAEVFRSRGSLECVESFAFQDLDGIRDPVGGILVTTMYDG